MQSAANKSATRRDDITIRMGCTQDIETLVDIDSDASVLFELAGLRLDFPNEHEVAIAERNRWLHCLSAGTVLIAASRSGRDVGFAAVGLRDREPYLDQLSVRVSSMRQGIGTELLYGSMRIAEQLGGCTLWLTTYNHLSWNRPYYERHGFAFMAPEQCGEELRCELLFEQRLLPRPEERVVMRRDLAAHGF